MKPWQIVILTYLAAGIIGVLAGPYFSTLGSLVIALVISLLAWRWIEIARKR